MTFDEILAQVIELLRHEQRVSYRALKRRFALDEDYLEDLKDEIIKAKRLACDEDGAVLVWIGARAAEQQGPLPTTVPPRLTPATTAEGPGPAQDCAERRQLTVMFCDLVGSTALSARLDPEDLRELIHGYHAICGEVIARYEGHIAQYLGDGLLVYFGYPVAHEDDTQRAVHAALGILLALATAAPSKTLHASVQQGDPLQVRIGIHCGPVVIGEVGAAGRHESLALGETPNLAARVQAEAAPDTVAISSALFQLVEGLFDCESLGSRELKGIANPQALYRVIRASEARRQFEATVRKGLTPLIGRSEELQLLRQRWVQAGERAGQVVSVSGEAGIGKSRLVQALMDQVVQGEAVRIELRCSRQHQNSAWYPVLDHLRRLLRFADDEPPPARFSKLENTLASYRFPQRGTVSLLATLLALPLPSNYPPLTLTPHQQREETQTVLINWLLEETEQATLFSLWEDLQWADPSTLELLQLFIAQVPAARIMLVLTYRSDFTPVWPSQSSFSQISLGRLDRAHATAMVAQITGDHALPATMVQDIVTKTDGVPLFVEEMTKMLRSDVSHDNAIPALSIPSSLQDLLVSRLDRLPAARDVAQVASALGRTFSYDLLRAVSELEDAPLQAALARLVSAEILFQRGLPPRAQYRFKHALMQDAAYQSVLKSTRRQRHRRIAQVLEQRFPDTPEAEPELLAHHYTEAELFAQAVPYWRQAGTHAAHHSAHAEAISHLRKGLELVTLLPPGSERDSEALALRIALCPLLIANKGNAAAEVEQIYREAFALCQHAGDNAQHFSVLFGLRSCHLVGGNVHKAHELGAQLLHTAELAEDQDLKLEAHLAFGNTCFIRGDFIAARAHFEQCLAHYDRHRHQPHATIYGLDPGLFSLGRLIWTLWALGYPAQAEKKIAELQTLIQDHPHPYSVAISLLHAAWGHFLRSEAPQARRYAEAAQALSAKHHFPHLAGGASLCRGWALLESGRPAEGLADIQHGLAACRATGATLLMSCYTSLLAEAFRQSGDHAQGLPVVAEALQIAQQNGESLHTAELYRLQGELIAGIPEADGKPQAEVLFRLAIDIARGQAAKSLELRATLSLARLLRPGSQSAAARKLLEAIYGWFTEGHATKDLTEAKVMLDTWT